MYSGIGGFELSLLKNGFHCIGYSEINKRAIEIYERHFNGHKNYGDADSINASDLPDFELLVGGFPCQAFSIAGNRAGFDDIRGSQFFNIARIVKAKRPQRILLENVKGLLSHDKGRTYKTILSTLTELGYDTEAMVLNSFNFFAAPRSRVFIYAVLRNEKTDVWKRDEQTFPLYATFCKGLRLANDTARTEEVRRSSERIIRTFANLPDWMDSWDTIYGTESVIG
jgi:DNA (cytosine-5)-methyltransferase 1